MCVLYAQWVAIPNCCSTVKQHPNMTAGLVVLLSGIVIAPRCHTGLGNTYNLISFILPAHQPQQRNTSETSCVCDVLSSLIIPSRQPLNWLISVPVSHLTTWHNVSPVHPPYTCFVRCFTLFCSVLNCIGDIWMLTIWTYIPNMMAERALYSIHFMTVYVACVCIVHIFIVKWK